MLSSSALRPARCCRGLAATHMSMPRTSRILKHDVRAALAGGRARRRYMWWVHLPVLHVVFVELRRDGPDRPRTLLRLADLLHACWCRALMCACATWSHDPVPLTVIWRLLLWRGGRVCYEPISSPSFLRGLRFPVQKHLGDSLHRCAYSLPRC